nr:hypothetical protein [Pseudofrankia asymbiotica]
MLDEIADGPGLGGERSGHILAGQPTIVDHSDEPSAVYDWQVANACLDHQLRASRTSSSGQRR